jgi:hypothetical protein
MSTVSARPSGMTWALVVLSLPLLYVLTWPPIEIGSLKFARWRIARKYPPPPPGPTITKTGTGVLVLRIQPTIIRVAYRPLHRITPFKDSTHPLTRYWEGWCKMLDESPGNYVFAEFP